VKYLLLAMALVFPIAAHAQVPPSKWTQNYIPTLTDWKAALLYDGQGFSDAMAAMDGAKLNRNGDTSNNQTLASPTLTNATVTAASFTCQNSLACIVSSLIQYSPPWAQSVERSLLLKLEDTVSVKDFGAKGTGVDDTAAISSAVSAMCSRGYGGKIYFPSGTYGFNAASPVTVGCTGVYLIGDGWGFDKTPQGYSSTIKVIGSGTAPLFTFSAPTPNDRYFYGGGIRQMTFVFTNTPTSLTQLGPIAKFEHCANCEIENVFSYGAYNGFVAFAGFRNHYSNVYLNQMVTSKTVNQGHGFEIYGDETGSSCASSVGNCETRMDVTYIKDFHIDFNFNEAEGILPSTGIWIHDFAQTVWLDHGTMGQPHIGINITCENSSQLGTCPGFISIMRVEAEVNAMSDTAGAACLVADNFTHMESFGLQCYGYNKPNNLIRLRASRFAGGGSADFHAGYVNGAGNSCISVAVKDFKMIGGDVYGCNQNLATVDGISDTYGIGLHLQAGDTSTSSVNSGSNIISNVNFCDGSLASETAMGAVKLDVGMDYNIVTNNVMRGCSIGIQDNSGGGSTNNLTGNVE